MPKKCRFFAAFLLLALLSASLYFYSHFYKNENKKFENFTNRLFLQEVSGSTITLHYTLKNPQNYNIRSGPVGYGSFSSDAATACASLENTSAFLHSFDSAQLTKTNRLTYEVLDDYLEQSLKLAPYTLYNDPLAPMTGIQAQLPILLSEYQFYSSQDVDTYLELLKKTPEYFQSLLSFEQKRADAGLFMPSYSAADIIDECRDFIAQGDDNYLISTFSDRLSSLGLSEKQNNAYINKNKTYIQKHIMSSYLNLADGLEDLQNSGRNQKGLCYLPNGKSYYEALVHSETGSARNITELQKLTISQMQEDLSSIQRVVKKDPNKDTFSQAQNLKLVDKNPTAILSTLAGKINDDFPQLSDIHTQVKYVTTSMEDCLSPAFYMIPPIDNSNENVIYVNKKHMNDDLTLFTTLAHEGYPGHLYQTVYYSRTNPPAIRTLLSFSGYTEGWATYCEMISYYYTPLSKDQAILLQKNASLLLGLYALADMGIHYTGWSIADTITFFAGYGITDADTVKSIYQLIIADPANYLKYYIGYLEFLELKKEAIANWGSDFSQKKFHQTVLEIGPATFPRIRKYLSHSTGK